MAENILHISAITSETRNWSAQVRVVTKLSVRTGIISPTKYQKMLLADELGDSIEAIMFRSDINLFKDTLEEGKTYKISNAQVSKVKELYRNDLMSVPYQWIIGSHTSIMPLDEGIISAAVFRPNFIAYDKYAQYLDTKKLICTTCVIIAKRAPKILKAGGQTQILHEYAALDQQMVPFVIAFWGDIVTNVTYAILDSTHKRPTVALLNFVVKGYYGLSLSSSSSSVVLTQLEHESIEELRKWRIQEKVFIDELVEKDGFFEESIEARSAHTIPASDVIGVLTTEKHPERFHIKGKGCLANESQSFLFMCCEDCRHGVNVAYNSLFRCNTCGTNKIAKPRFRVCLTVSDHTGTIEVTTFGIHSELILGMSAQQFYDQTSNSGVPPVEHVNSMLGDVTMSMIIRSSLFGTQTGLQITTYNVLALELVPNDPPTLHITPKKEDGGATKRKLDFGGSIAMTKEQPTGSSTKNSLDSSSLKRRLVKLGKAKFGADRELTGKAGSVDPLENCTLHYSNSSDDTSLDDLLTLSDIAQSNKSRQLSIKTSPRGRDSNQTNTCYDAEMPLHKDRKGKKKQTTRKSVKHIVIDDNSSTDELDVGQGLEKQHSTSKDTADEVMEPKRSTKGRVLKPKKHD